MSCLIYFSKNSWWDERKARKTLLPLAFSRLEACSAVLVNAATAVWQQVKHPPVWRHPDSDMVVLSPLRWLPSQRFGFIRGINQWFRWRMVRPFIQTNDDCVVVLSDPEDVFIARFARKAGLECWFDWTEEWDAYARAAGNESTIKVDVSEIFDCVDGLIVVSRLLEKRAKAMGLDVLHIPNAVSEAFIDALKEAHRKEAPKILDGIPRPIAVHIGSCDPAWIDWKCLIQAATRNPGISFCMIGGGGEDYAPSRLPENVHMLGRLPYERLPAILAHVDLCLLLYRPDQTAGGDPTKLYEYLASGRPVVSTPHPRSLEFSEWISIADSPEAFAEAVRKGLEDRDADNPDRRREIAHRQSWTCRARMLRQGLFDR
ncbi:glycosyltransferase [Candidatus Parcubacteria bacterium]|nr:MAG: glycosyltransferase [Candidatus Parcubacteria bacterium]